MSGILMLSALLIFTRKRALICIRVSVFGVAGMAQWLVLDQKWGEFVGNQPPFSVATGLLFLIKLDSEVVLMLSVRDTQVE
jgi:hypothetical protein